MGRKSVVKGKVFERDVARAFVKVGIYARRMAPLQARIGDEVPDVEVTVPTWRDPLVLGVECKVAVRPPNPHSCWSQAAASAGRRIPVVVSRTTGNGCALATMRLDDLINLLQVICEQSQMAEVDAIDLAAAAARLGVVTDR